MAPTPPQMLSFSPRQRWVIAARVALSIALVISIVVMANYLSHQPDCYARIRLSERTRLQLSSRTVAFLKTVTNNVKTTILYDRADPLYSTVADLLNEYHLVNPRISVQTVDYLRDPGAAQRIKAAHQLASGEDKNVVIFDADGTKSKIVDGKALAQYTLEQMAGEKEPSFRRKPVAFLGDVAFTAAILDVTSKKPFVACFLRGHKEHDIDSGDEVTGYLSFASLLKQNYIRVQSLSLAGTNPVPSDCNLLVIAGPLTPIPEFELEKISRYLNEGGRLLALLNSEVLNRDTGLERVLADWGVAIGNRAIVDPEHSSSGSDVIISAFNKHPLVNPLLGSGLYLIQPRPVGKLRMDGQSADVPRVEEVAFTGEHAFFLGAQSTKRLFPVMATVERSEVKGVLSERGHTRIIVVGDSFFLANRYIGWLGNRDFAGYAANWLLERTQLLEGVGPRPVEEYRVIMSRTQMKTAQLVLLGGMPGIFLLIGGMVWLRRRQ